MRHNRKIINLAEYKAKNYKSISVYFNKKLEDYWCTNEKVDSRTGYKLIYSGLLSNKEVITIESGGSLSSEYGMFR